MTPINAVLPSEEVSPDQIEDTMSMLSDMGITVVESEDHEVAAAPDGEDGAVNDDAVGRAVAIATPVPDLKALALTLNIPSIPHASLAADSVSWRNSHAAPR